VEPTLQRYDLEAMPRSPKFIEPIVLKDGRTIATLGQAREIMLSIPLQHREFAVWRFADVRLKEAVIDPALVDEAESLLRRALRSDDML
jgi:hypothetical protein